MAITTSSWKMGKSGVQEYTPDTPENNNVITPTSSWKMGSEGVQVYTPDTPGNTNVITPASLQPTAEMKTLTPNDGMDYYNQQFNNAIAGYGDLQNTVNANTTNTTNSVNEVSSLSDMLLGKTADTQAANETAGVNSERANNTNLTNQLNDNTAQINALARQAQAIPMQTQQDAEKRVMTDAGAAPITAAGLRENAIKALTLGQKSDILNASLTNSSNRLADAKDKAAQIVDLKYKPIEDKITNLKDQLAMNKEYITDPAEKKLAEQQASILNERSRVLQDQKDKELAAENQKIEVRKNVDSIALAAAQNGASADVLKAISSSTDMQGAIMAAGTSLQTPNTQMVTLEDGNTVLVDSKTGNVIKNFGGAKPVKKDTQIITNADGSQTLIDTQTGATIKNVSGAAPKPVSIPDQLDAAAAGYNIDENGKITTSATVSIPPTTLAGKNNNPGNLRFVGQAGASKGQGGFASFATPEAGYQALLAQISLDSSRGLTVAQFVNKYAPPSENNTGQYITQFTAKLGCSSSAKLSTLDLGKVGEFMAMKESGTKITGAPTTDSGIAGVSNDDVSNYAQNVLSGALKITQVKGANTAQTAALQKAVSNKLIEMGNDANGNATITPMGKEALTAAQQLMTLFDASDKGNNAVGASGATNAAYLYGNRRDFIIKFENFVNKLVVDSSKLLKGQGQISDAERDMLSKAVSGVKLNQTDDAFRASLQEIINKLSNKTSSDTGTTTSYSGVYLPGAVTSNLNVFNGVSLPN